MKAILLRLANKYVLSILFFVVWLLFFDHNDIMQTYQRRQELRELREQKKIYEEKTKKATEELKAIKNNPAALEKVAREKYLMKKNNEDVFLIQ